MAIGIRIKNDTGTTQIDEKYYNLFLVDKHTNTISLPDTTAYEYVIAGDVVAIAVKCWPETFTTTAVTFSGGVWTYRVSFYNNPDTTGSCTFTIYAFGKAPTPTATVGLKVKKPSGELIYHSQFKPLRIVSVVGGASGYTGPSGRTLAVMVLGMPLYGFSVPPFNVFDTFSPRVMGNVIEVKQVSVALTSPDFVGFVRAGSYAAVDVTDY